MPSRPIPASPPHEERAHLELIAQMSEGFAHSLDVEETLALALDTVTRHLDAEAGSIFLCNPDRETLVCSVSSGPVDLRGLELEVGEGVVGDSVKRNACALVRDALSDPRFQPRIDSQTGFTTRSILCASLAVGDRSLGAIELINKRRGDGRFDDEDRRVLRALAAGAGLALENARLAGRLVEQERVRRELELAAEIQRSLLPASRPAPFPVSGLNIPVREVSGDFYDFLELPDRRFGFCVGDVSGKGFNAALLMAKTTALYRCLAKEGLSPGELLRRLNAELHETTTRGMFVTLAAGWLDARTGTVRLANAGHEPPLLLRPDGSRTTYPAQAPPLGVTLETTENGCFPEEHLSLEGGALYLYTDGLTEAYVDGGPLGADGIASLLERHAADEAEVRLKAVLGAVRQEFRNDDMTLVVVESNGLAA